MILLCKESSFTASDGVVKLIKLLLFWSQARVWLFDKMWSYWGMLGLSLESLRCLKKCSLCKVETNIFWKIGNLVFNVSKIQKNYPLLALFICGMFFIWIWEATSIDKFGEVWLSDELGGWNFEKNQLYNSY